MSEEREERVKKVKKDLECVLNVGVFIYISIQ